MTITFLKQYLANIARIKARICDRAMTLISLFFSLFLDN